MKELSASPTKWSNKNNSLDVADELLECVWQFCVGLALTGLRNKIIPFHANVPRHYIPRKKLERIETRGCISYEPVSSMFRVFLPSLTLPAQCISENFIKIKLTYIYIFTLLYGVSKCFTKAFQAFMKPFEVPQGSLKIKIYTNFFS